MESVKRRRAKRGDRTTTGEQLLDAAAALMSERDTADVALADVAERAGANIALVKYYFGNKEGMMLQLFKREASKIIQEFRALILMDSISSIEKLKRHIYGQIMIYYRFPYFDGLLRNLLRDASSDSAKEVSNHIRPLSDGQARLLTEAHDAGFIRKVDPVTFFFAVAGACHYLFAAKATLKHVFGGNGVDDELCRKYAADTTRMILEGLRTPEGRPLS